jgi:predicted CxxxxCH...CXXCH cytochrome family protein
MMAWRTVIVATLLAGCADPRAVDGTRRCATAADCEAIHPPGIADPASADFHGALVPALGWNLASCATCHGADFAGGKSGKTCLKCHDGGPTACTTCHALPPATGAHAAHGYACSECHVMPATWDAPGHLFDGHGGVIARAQVTLGPIAASGGATPTWDGERCSNTYCHGSAAPAWNGGPSEAPCGSCHAVPPADADHVNPRCSECHGRVVDDAKHIVGAALHANGIVNVGDDSGTCLTCHPSPGAAHAAHTTAAHRIAAPIGCATCHRVPASLHDPGHIDHPRAIVFPDGPALWDATTGQCSNVECHGATTPSWTGPPVVCGSCHGVPPGDAPHTPAMRLQDCASCHARSIDASGQLLVPPGGKHLDGVVDAP